jgi:pimeloyl-ACP methyl ester carboxylesterase
MRECVDMNLRPISPEVWQRPRCGEPSRLRLWLLVGLLLVGAVATGGLGASRREVTPKGQDGEVTEASAQTGSPGQRFSVALLAPKSTKAQVKATKKQPKKVTKKPAKKPSKAPSALVTPEVPTDLLSPNTEGAIPPASVASLPVPIPTAGAIPTAAPIASVVPVPTLPPVLPVAAPAVFSVCKDSKLECATVAAPFDPANPTGDRIDLFVSRRKATGPAPRVGVLFVNPGGPGGPAYDTVRSAATFFTPEILERFDVVGVDPRGTQRSAPLKCDTAPKARTGANGARLSYADAFADSCSTNDAARLLFMDTQTAARDLDAVRVALGEQQINFLGMSYGTYLGAVYRAQFPDRVRSMILDSAVDPSRFGVNMLLDPIAATEKALDGFLDECASGRLMPCSFNDGTDLRAKYLAVREAFIKGSRFSRANAERTFDEQIAAFIGYPRNGWPILGRALEELAKTGSGVFRVLPTDNQSTSDSERLTSLDAFSDATNLAINCRDGILPRDPAADQQVRDGVPVVGPRFSGLTASSTAADSCVNWGAPVTPQVPLGPQLKASTLIIGNTFDLTTPYVWSQGLAAVLQAPLLTRNGGGHVAVTKSACIREASARFLIDNIVPGVGTICSPSLENPS